MSASDAMKGEVRKRKTIQKMRLAYNIVVVSYKYTIMLKDFVPVPLDHLRPCPFQMRLLILLEVGFFFE